MNETLNIQNGVSPITIDTEVTEGSMRPVTSDGIYKAVQAGGRNLVKVGTYGCNSGSATIPVGYEYSTSLSFTYQYTDNDGHSMTPEAGDIYIYNRTTFDLPANIVVKSMTVTPTASATVANTSESPQYIAAGSVIFRGLIYRMV